MVTRFACIVLIGAGASGSSVAQPLEGSADIRITSATFGGNCGAPEGNLTWPLVQACDGRSLCRYQVGEETVEALAADPEKCANRLTVQWRCGNRPATFEAASPARATPPGIQAGYVLLFGCPPEAVDELRPPKATLRSVQKANRPALPREFDAVRILRDGARIPTELGITLRVGDEISTADDTVALLYYPDAAQVTVKPGSRVRVSSLLVELGSVIVDVFDTFVGVFEVKTVYVTAGARGTVFEVTVDPSAGRATVSVAEGFVELDPHTGAWDDLLVKEGETVVIEAEEEPLLEIAARPVIETIVQSADRADQLAYCRERAGDPMANGEVLTKVGAGPNIIEVNNGNDRDALVKFKDQSATTVLSFYVQARRKARIENVPHGNFTVSWATGRQFSRECNLFLEDMSASTSQEVMRMSSAGGQRWTVRFTLHRVEGGTMPVDDLPLDDFLRD
jgi:hypothetical protein